MELLLALTSPLGSGEAQRGQKIRKCSVNLYLQSQPEAKMENVQVKPSSHGYLLVVATDVSQLTQEPAKIKGALELPLKLAPGSGR